MNQRKGEKKGEKKQHLFVGENDVPVAVQGGLEGKGADADGVA